MVELFLSSYSKECLTESYQLKFCINLFKDLKTANTILKTSLESDLKSLDSFTKSLSYSSCVFMKEIKSLTGNEVNFVNICNGFGIMFDSLSKIYTEKFSSIITEIHKELEENAISLSRITQYIQDLNSSSLKDLSNTRQKYKGAINKKEKAFKDLEYYVKKLDDNSIITDKIVNLYCDYTDIARNTKLIYSKAKESEAYMEKCLSNNLLNSTCCFVEYYNKTKNIFIILMKLKKEFYEQCFKMISSYLDTLEQNNTINMNESNGKLNEVKNLSIEDIKASFKINPESNEINSYIDTLALIITHRKNIISLLSQFLSNVFRSYELLVLESKKKKLYQFKAQYCPLLESTFISKMMTFFLNLNELFISKNSDFFKQNPLIIPSIDGFIKELCNEESYLTSCVIRLKKEITLLKTNYSKGSTKTDIIEESYSKLNKFSEDFIGNINNVLIRFSDLTKAIDSLKSSSIDNITKQLAKLFECLFDYMKINETVVTTDSQLEDDTKKLFGRMLAENKLNDNIINDLLHYAISFSNKQKYSLDTLPDLFLIKPEEKLSALELQMPINLNEIQLKELKEKSEKKSIKKSMSSKKIELYSSQINIDVKDNEKVEDQQTTIALIDNLLVLGFILKLNNSYVFSSAYTKQSLFLDLKSIELKSDDNSIKIISRNNKAELIIVKDKTTDLFIDNLNKEIEKLKKSNINEELVKKQNEVFNLAPNIEITKEKFKEILNKITQMNFEEINKKQILHKQFREHYIIDQLLRCQVKISENETKELPIPIYLIFNILYNPQYCSKAFPNFDSNFIRSLQNIRNEYDIVFTETNFNLGNIPSYFTRKAEETFNFLSKFPIEEIPSFIEECRKYPLVQEFNYTYYHPIPNPILLGPKLLQINDTYKFVFMSPTCFIVEIKSQSSGFMLLDSFYTVARYRYDAEFDDNLILCNTRINAEFTIEFVKEIWFKSKVETNGYAENENYITTFMIPNMIKELEINGRELYLQFANDIAKVDVLPSKQIDSCYYSINQQKINQITKTQLQMGYTRSMLYFTMIAVYLLFVTFQNVFNNYLGNNSGLYLLLFVIITELVYLSSQLEKINENKNSES